MNTLTQTICKTMGLLTAMAMMNGCGNSTRDTGEKTPQTVGNARHLYVGLDASVSFRPNLGVSATLCTRQALQLEPETDLLSLFRLDSSTDEFFDDPPPESGEKLQRTIVTEVQRVPATQGTYPARFWNAVALRAKDDTCSVIIETFSDGDNDDQTAESQMEIRRAAQDLASNPHVVSISVFGADPRNWATLRSEFAPLGKRFHLCTPSEMTMERVAGTLDTDR